jgi:hypothetical protein
MKKLMLGLALLFIPVGILNATEQYAIFVKDAPTVTATVEADGEIEEVVFRKLAKGTALVIRGTAKAVTPDLFKVSIYTKDGQTVEFYRYGMSAYTLHKRVLTNARTNGVLRLWGQREMNGPYVQIPGIPLSNIQNIAVIKVVR